MRMPALALTAAALLFGSAAATTVVAGSPPPPAASLAVAAERPSTPRPAIQATIVPIPLKGVTSPSFDVSAAGTALCDDPEFVQALQAGDDRATVLAAGGAAAFRAAVATGAAPCIRLDDPARTWVVVNKQRPYAPSDFAPVPLAPPAGMTVVDGQELRADAAAALSAMAAAARQAGVGEIALGSGFRSFATQEVNYAGHVADFGPEGADLVSARPGFSEHQSGLGADVVACEAGTCGSIDDLAGTAQGAWIAAHAWEHGWIVRYLDGRTPVTGYSPEPWHLRYVGPELARAYHDGGWTTLEEFFGLPAAPVYPG